ncbi:unnamed protein product [Rhizophagus irregularis]|nr:unnamed protein product [Rhizophagus irregularis]
MLPWQRNNKKWFPNWIYYDLPVTEARKLINAIDNEQTVFNYPPLINQTKEELKQQMEFIMKNIGVEKIMRKNKTVRSKNKKIKLEKQMEQTKEELPNNMLDLSTNG